MVKPSLLIGWRWKDVRPATVNILINVILKKTLCFENKIKGKVRLCV